MSTDSDISHDPDAAAAEVLHLARTACGFALVGITDARISDHADFVRQWIAAGQHGEMHYLANHLDIRLDPTRLVDGAASIIAVADFYHAESTAGAAAADPPVPRGRIARYAHGDDYHKVMKSRLHQLADLLAARYPGHAFRATVDTAPALEREHAARAGLGWQGKNTMTIHPRHGSYFLLGLLVTTLPLSPTQPAAAPPDHCGTCTRCIDACPTGCITSSSSSPGVSPRTPGVPPRSIDATRCISYLTLEHRSAIDPSLHPPMGDWIAGCDVCQEVCPFNRRANEPPTVPVHPRYAPRATFAAGLPLLDLLGWTEDDRRHAFTASALKRIKLDMLKRNALIAAGNHLAARDDAALRQRVATIAGDESEPPLVRTTAEQVLNRLQAIERPGVEPIE